MSFSASLRSILALSTLAGSAFAQTCPEVGPINPYQGAGVTTCPCFVAGEEAGSVFTTALIPASEFPIEITKIAFAWGSVGGGQPQSLEDAVVVYGAGLPNPGAPLFTLPGPVMTDGFINEFDIASQWPGLGPVIINAPPFTVALRFANDNNVPPYPPSMVHDGNGCTAGRNVVKVNGAFWFSACTLGVSGDWVTHVQYRRLNCPPPIPGTPFCFGDGTLSDHTTPCPCGNSGDPGNGCAHSFSILGANLVGEGAIPNDDVVLHATGMPSTAFTLFMQHDAPGDTIFHDGTLCAGGNLVRLRGRAAAGGEARFPDSNFANDSMTLSTRGGVTVGSGAQRRYAAWYRNASTTFCPPATANVSNGWKITW